MNISLESITTSSSSKKRKPIWEERCKWTKTLLLKLCNSPIMDNRSFSTFLTTGEMELSILLTGPDSWELLSPICNWPLQEFNDTTGVPSNRRNLKLSSIQIPTVTLTIRKSKPITNYYKISWQCSPISVLTIRNISLGSEWFMDLNICTKLDYLPVPPCWELLKLSET